MHNPAHSRAPAACLLLCLLAWSLPAAAESPYDSYALDHWSLKPVSRPAVPQFNDPADRAWVRNAVDAFVLAGLKRAGLQPAPPADPRTLVRRLYFDLIGLPPSPDEVDRFLADPSPTACEQLVDRLLADPRYGQRWGQRWLDVVRFAETEGFEYDALVAGAWRYRDWVIQALNDDKPYDRFLLEQLAGDELDPSDEQLQIAAGFHRLGPVRRNAGNAEVASSRNEVLTELTNVVGSALLGLSIGCARCHDHVFDPVLQRDYYQLQAFFAPLHARDIPLADDQTYTAWKADTDAVTAEIKRLQQAIERGDPLEAELAEAQGRLPPPLPSIATVENDPQRRTAIHVLQRGEPDQPGQPVQMQVLGVLAARRPPPDPDFPTPRTFLAQWITSPDHPLTARVMVNRVWQGHFGRGIVDTPNDFGINGDEPSHRELLDYLAAEFVAGPWRIKALHRLICNSASYRQASRSPWQQRAQRVDPENRLLWRANRQRLDAETLRDAMLAVAGRLNPKIGGPSVIVPLDSDLVTLLYKPSQWEVTPDAAEHDRRSVYLLAKRNLRLPFMEAFDQPDRQSSCGVRQSSTHAPQALELLNGSLSNELADALAERLARQAGQDPRRQVRLAFLLAAGRPPTDQEERLSLEFLSRQPLREFALAVFNLNAFLYVD